jgi:hypothetical protein
MGRWQAENLIVKSLILFRFQSAKGIGNELFVHRKGDRRVGIDAFDLRSEKEKMAVVEIEKGFEADMIARAEEVAAIRIEYGKGSRQVVRTLNSEFFIGLQDEYAVR